MDLFLKHYLVLKKSFYIPNQSFKNNEVSLTFWKRPPAPLTSVTYCLMAPKFTTATKHVKIHLGVFFDIYGCEIASKLDYMLLRKMLHQNSLSLHFNSHKTQFLTWYSLLETRLSHFFTFTCPQM